MGNTLKDNVARSWIEEVRGQKCLEILGRVRHDETEDADATSGAVESADNTPDEVQPETTEPTQVTSAATDVDFAPHADCSPSAIAPKVAEEHESATQRSQASEGDAAGVEKDAEGRGTVEPPDDEPFDELQITREVTSYGFMMWLTLSHWTRMNHVLEQCERNFAYSIGHMIRRDTPPSFAQARRAKSILKKARQAGLEIPSSKTSKP